MQHSPSERNQINEFEINAALVRAETYCSAKGLRFTALRRIALRALLQENRALGAYDLLKHFKKAGHADQPPVAYRALEFLTRAGLAHKIQALNAYVACRHSDCAGPHTPAFLVCTECRRVNETDWAPQAISPMASVRDFAIHHTVIEAIGLCDTCR